VRLAQVLGRIPKYHDPNVLVGFETADDAGVYRIDAHRALVQTVDFFTPVVDDPHSYGAIAAANSLSDVYAMGGIPLTAMAITCFPEKGDLEVLTQMMLGGAEKLRDAGVALLGGHTVADMEIKFGYAITGIIDPGRVLTNTGARPGDALVLTKPLGIGILTTGIKFRKTSPEAAARAIRSMCTLNRKASEAMLRHDSHSATDVTGNGLLGHAYEMAAGSKAALRIRASQVPYITDAYRLAEAKVLPGAVAKNWKLVERYAAIDARIPEPLRNILLDPQTSGGLLISVGPGDLSGLMADLQQQGVEEAAAIGAVEEARGPLLIVE
jgi:selenide,water dikinase